MSPKKIVAAALTPPLIIGMTLGAMFVLVRTTLVVMQVPNPMLRGAAVAAELLLGVILLLGTVWVATHIAVRIFRRDAEPPQLENK